MSVVLSIAPYKFLPAINGGHWGVHIVDSILAQHNQVHTLTVSTTETREAVAYNLHPLLSENKRRYVPYATSNIIKDLGRRIKADYIFCHHHYMFPSAYRAGRSLNIPVYIRSHNIEAERFKSSGKAWWPAMKAFEQAAYRKADKVFFVTNEDREWAIQHYKLSEEKTIVMPFGIDFNKISIITDDVKPWVAQEYNLNAKAPWFFFMGMLSYIPNAEAVELITDEIYPLLKQEMKDFEILICGKDLRESVIQKIKSKESLHYLGFVPSLEPVIASCEAMINPVLRGGGVKTKVIEALAHNKNVVSTRAGALGIEKNVCGEKLSVAADNDWEKFVGLMQGSVRNKTAIPASFQKFYALEHIAERVQPYFL